MSDTEKKSNWADPKLRRKILYAGAVVLGIILAGVGLIDPDQIDATVERILDVGGPLLSLVGIKAFRNVDAPAREVDAERAKAREEARAEALTQARAEARAETEKMLAQVREQARESATQVGDILAARLDELPAHLSPTVADAVRAVYDQPYGRHDAAAPEPAPDPAGPGRYPGEQ